MKNLLLSNNVTVKVLGSTTDFCSRVLLLEGRKSLDTVGKTQQDRAWYCLSINQKTCFSAACKHPPKPRLKHHPHRC